MANTKPNTARSIPPGGPATINGIVYQLLWSLLRASRARVRSASKDESGNFTGVLLTLEPAGGGGDLVVTDQDEEIVEQLKARPDAGTWSLREVIEGVIPDLYIGCSNTPEKSRFRLVTEGRIGQWERVYDFFRSLKSRPCPADDPILDLDANAKLTFGGHTQSGNGNAFWNRDSYTEATLFERIVEEVRKRKAISEREDESTTQRNLHYLLGNFEFVGEQNALQLQQEIDSNLLPFVDHHEQIPQIRDAMLLDLARRASEGCAEIDASDFFRQYGLDSVPLTDWSSLRTNAAKQVDNFLWLRGYNADLDVRTSRAFLGIGDWPKTTPILAITGESGQGKSWRAYRMAIEARMSPQIVVTVVATGDANRSLESAAETLWHEITRHNASIPLSQIADRVNRVMGTRFQPWMLLVIDGVQEQQEALELVKRPWEQ